MGRLNRVGNTNRVAVALVLVLVSCTPSSTASSSPERGTSTTGEAGESSTSGAPASAAAAGGVESGLGNLDVSPEVAAPGGLIDVSTPPGPGAVIAVGPDGRRIVSEDGASIRLPDDAAPGRWAVVTQGDSPGIGIFQVMAADGPALRADRTWLGPDDVAEVTLEYPGSPEGKSVMFGWGDLNWEEYFDDTTDAEPLGILVPDEDGLLQAGSEPVPLSGVVGRTLVFSAVPAASVQAIVVDEVAQEVETSNPVTLRSCEERSTVNGLAPGGGWLHAVSVSDRVRTAGMRLEAGDFAFAAPAGSLFAVIALDDGVRQGPVIVDVPCGGSVTLTDGGADTTADTSTGSSPDSNGYAEEEGWMVLSGAYDLNIKVLPVCQYRREEIGVIFAVDDLTLPALSVAIPGAGSSGSFEGAFELTDWGAGGIQSVGSVDVQVTYRSGLIPYADVTLEGPYDGSAGSGTVTAAFGCTVLGAPSQGQAPTGDEPRIVLASLTGQSSPFDSGPNGSACTTVVVEGDDPGLAARIRADLPGAGVVTGSEIQTMLDSLGASDVLTLGELLTNGSGPPRIDVAADGDGYLVDGVSGGGAELLETVAGGGLCVSVAPASDAARSALVTATDLMGRPVSGEVTVTPNGGGDTVTGSLVDGGFEFHEPAYSVGAAVTVTSVGGAAASTAWAGMPAPAIVAAANRVVLNPDDDLPIAPGPLGVSLVARRCDATQGRWEGLIAYEAGPYLGLIGTFGAVSLPVSAAIEALSTNQGIPDLFDLMATSLDGLPYATALAAVLAMPVDDPRRPLLFPADFEMPPPGGTRVLMINGKTSDTIEIRRLRRQPDVLRFSVRDREAGTTTWLFSPRVKHRNGCPSADDMVRQLKFWSELEAALGH